MTTVISIPDQIEHIENAHTAILKSITEDFKVFGSLTEFEDQETPVKPDLIILDFGWLRRFHSFLHMDNPIFPDISKTPIIIVKGGLATESDFNNYSGNIVAVIHGEDQTPNDFLYNHMMSELNKEPLTDEQLDCGLRRMIQRVIDVQAKITDRPVTRFDVTGKGKKPHKYAKFVP